jgi:hypothetical protein
MVKTKVLWLVCNKKEVNKEDEVLPYLPLLRKPINLSQAKQ